MPSSSEKQRKYVFYLRNKYGSKDKAPDKYKWAFEKGWEKIEEYEFTSDYEKEDIDQYDENKDDEDKKEFHDPRGFNMKYECKAVPYISIFKRK